MFIKITNFRNLLVNKTIQDVVIEIKCYLETLYTYIITIIIINLILFWYAIEIHTILK